MSRRLSTLLAFLTSSVAPLSLAYSADEIVISATKKKTNLRDLGANVALISGEDIQKGNGFDGAEDIVNSLSGVQAAIANGNQVAFQIRGIGAVDHQALTPTAAAVYQDGVYLSTNVQNSLLTFDLERVEVLKGPQGSLYGRNASGGAIHFLSKRPNGEKSGYVEATIGNFDTLNLTAAYGDAINDNWSYRIAGRRAVADAYLKNVSGIQGSKNAGGKKDEFGLRAQVLFDNNDDTEILFNVHYSEDNGINPAPRNSALDISDHQISVGRDGIQDTDNEFYGAFVEITKEYPSFTLYSQTAYEGYNQQYGFDFDGTTAPFGNQSLNANLAYDRDLDQLSQEFRINIENDRSRTLFGLYGTVEKFQQDYLIWCGELNRSTNLGTCRYVGTPPRTGSTPVSSSTAFSLLSQIDQVRSTLAAFAFHEHELNEKLTMTLGGRYSWERISAHGNGRHFFEDGQVGFNNRNDLGLAIGKNTINDSFFTGNLGLYYKPDSTSLYYASLASGFKSGGFNGEVQNNATHFQDEGLFKAETVTTVEAGIKKFPADNLTLSLAAFYQHYDKPQARIFVPFPLPNGSSFTTNSLSNLNEAYSTGIEAAADWSPIEELSFSGNVTWLDTEIDEPLSPDTPQNNQSFDGNPLPFASDISASLRTSYNRTIANYGDVRGSVLIKHQGEFFFDPSASNDRKQKAYTTIDGNLSYKPENSNIEYSLWGQNLTDEDYAVSGFAFIGYNTFRSKPRSYGVKVSLDF